MPPEPQVPQRILMALGTLADQLTYPSVLQPAERTEEVEKQLQGLLDLVGIGYLVERYGNNKNTPFLEPFLDIQTRSTYQKLARDNGKENLI